MYIIMARILYVLSKIKEIIIIDEDNVFTQKNFLKSFAKKLFDPFRL